MIGMREIAYLVRLSPNKIYRTVRYPRADAAVLADCWIKEHEFYLHPFLRSVQAGVASIMCSYSVACLLKLCLCTK